MVYNIRIHYVTLTVDLTLSSCLRFGGFQLFFLNIDYFLRKTRYFSCHVDLYIEICTANNAVAVVTINI